MRAKIGGVVFEGTPKEMDELMRLKQKNSIQSIAPIILDFGDSLSKDKFDRAVRKTEPMLKKAMAEVAKDIRKYLTETPQQKYGLCLCPPRNKYHYTICPKYTEGRIR